MADPVTPDAAPAPESGSSPAGSRQRVPWLRITAEFLVIFAGVTLSLLADDWRSEREDRAREDAILISLESDLEADHQELDNLLSRMQTWDTAGAKLHARLGSSGPPADSVDVFFRPMFFYQTYRPVSTAYGNLREGGQLSLVRDEDLRAAITEYYEIEQDYMIQFYRIVQETYFLWRRVAFRHVKIVPDEVPGSFFPPNRFAYRSSWASFEGDPEAPALLTDLSLAGGNFAARIEAAMGANARLQLELRRFRGEDL